MKFNSQAIRYVNNISWLFMQSTSELRNTINIGQKQSPRVLFKNDFLKHFANLSRTHLQGEQRCHISQRWYLFKKRLPSYWNTTNFKGTPRQIRKSYNILASVPQNLLTNDFSTNLYIWHRLSKYWSEFALVKVLQKSGGNIHKKKRKMNTCIICTTPSTFHTPLWMWRA